MIKLNEIEYRVSNTGTSSKGKPYAMFVVYIDARTASKELDEKYEGKWSFSWEMIEGQKWAVKGKLIVVKGEGKAFTYEDVGYPNDFKKKSDHDDTQWIKDAVSDALKRCAVQAGVGRVLYDAPFLYTEGVRMKERNGKKFYGGLTDTGEKELEKKISTWYADAVKDLNSNAEK